MQRTLLNKVGLVLLVGIIIASCNPKAKTEEKVATPPADSTKAPVEPIIDAPKKDSTKEEPVKKEVAPVSKPKKSEEKVVAKPVVKVPVKTTPAKEPEKSPMVETPPMKETVVETPPVKEPVKTEPPKQDTATVKKTEPEVKKPEGKAYYFKIIRKEDGKEIFGDLQLQETIGATQYQLVRSGQILHLGQPRNKRGSYNIIALLPGYKEKSLIFLYNNPPIETGPNNEEIITLVLDKAKTGDYVDFNNVHFFRNASVLRPTSKSELDQLVFLLKENPGYKIRIHGHCNGTQDRESYLMGTSTDFFTMNPKGNKKMTITSKELTQARAETVRDYLVQQGVATDRISVKAEGGKIPVYPENGTLAQYNDRVEVEFTKH